MVDQFDLLEKINTPTKFSRGVFDNMVRRMGAGGRTGLS